MMNFLKIRNTNLRLIPLMIIFLISGCADSLKGGKVSGLRRAQPGINFAGDSQLAASGQYSSDFRISNANAGGSFFKKKAVSQHFAVSGGVANGVQ